MVAAVRAVINKECNIADAVEVFNTEKTTLKRQTATVKEELLDTESYKYAPRHVHEHTLTIKKKERLVEYSHTLCKMSYGLTVKQLWQVVYK